MKFPFEWDDNNDRPKKLNFAYAQEMYQKVRLSRIKTVLIAAIILPTAYLLHFFIRKRSVESHRFFGMSVNGDHTQALQTIHELGIKSILIRVPMWKLHRLEQYAAFCARFENCEITITLIQDREHIEDLDLSRRDFERIFELLSPYAKRFQIGSSINRAEWGFFSVGEYVDFYAIAYWLNVHKFGNLELIGPGVRGFECHVTAHALFNDDRLRFEAMASLFDVDQHGAPEARKYGLSLFEKIKFQRALMLLSRNVGHELYITEANFALDNEQYVLFMLRYYLIAFATQQVDGIFGVIDSESEQVRKVYQTVLTHLQESTFVSYGVYDERDKIFESQGTFEKRHRLACKNRLGTVMILWSEQEHDVHFAHEYKVISYDGVQSLSTRATISDKPIYIYRS